MTEFSLMAERSREWVRQYCPIWPHGLSRTPEGTLHMEHHADHAAMPAFASEAVGEEESRIMVSFLVGVTGWAMAFCRDR